MSAYVAMFRSLARRVEEGRRVAFCTVVSAHGSTPQAAGASMLVHDDMTTEGTLGGGCVEGDVRRRAFELLGRGASGLLSFELDHDSGLDDGLICGGAMRVAVVSIETAETARPFSHVMSTSSPPLAQRPRTEPAGHTGGSAGSNCTVPAWLWSSISAMPEVAPKLPSIWKGGWASKRLG